MADTGYNTPRHFQRSARASISSGSPRPSASSPLVRAQWPWSTYVQRPTSAMSSPASTTINQWEATPSVGTSGPAAHSWTSTTPKNLFSPAMQMTPVQEDHGIKQWSFSAFEWNVPNARNLKEFVESQNPVVSTAASLHSDDSHASQGSGVPPVLRETPMVGDGKFKLEISRAVIDDTTSTTSGPIQTSDGTVTEPISITVNSEARNPPALSLCLTSLQLDYDPECEIATTVMAGIKCSSDFTGQRGARTEWVWEMWDDFVFRKGSEFWECTMPSLTNLLENPRISSSDSFTISIQLHTPVGPQFPQQPSAYYVPKDLLDGLEASLDNSNTGDVQFVCLERFDPLVNETQNTNDSQQPPSASTSEFPSSTARKRIIYAHSDILTRRSEYFATLLASSFRESAPNLNIHDRDRGRSIHTIVVEEADFITVYWLLKYLYCDWLLFRENDDPRAAVDGIGAGWSARWLSQGNEWDWKTFSPKTGNFEDSLDREEEATSKSVTSESVSAGSIVSVGGDRTNKAMGLAPPTTGARTPSRSGNPTALRSTGAHSSTPVSRRPSKLVTGNTTISSAAPPARSPSSSSRSSPPQALYYPLSPSQTRMHSTRQPDPHPHPTPAPTAASALSIYQIAHRYRIAGLQHHALDHMMSTISPRSAFPLLLATCFWDELHGMIQDYIVEHWQEVSRSEEFETCCQEVAAGEWGPEGGKTLASLFRRLHSPASTA